MLRALLLALATAAASVVAVAVPLELQPGRAPTPEEAEWLISRRNVSHERPPSYDTHLRYINLVNCHGPASTGFDYPVLVHAPSGTTFWASSWTNRQAFTIVGIDRKGDIVNAVYAPGARYICGIKFVDSPNRDIMFVGQGNVPVIVSRQQLLKRPAQPIQQSVIDPAAFRIGQSTLRRRQDETTAPTEPPVETPPPTQSPPTEPPPTTQPTSPPGSTEPSPPPPTDEPSVSTPPTVLPEPPETTSPVPPEPTGSMDPEVTTTPAEGPMTTQTAPQDPSETGTPSPTASPSFTESVSSSMTQSPPIDSPQPSISAPSGSDVPPSDTTLPSTPTTTDSTSNSTPPPLPPVTKTYTPPPPLSTETPPIVATETIAAPTPTGTNGNGGSGPGTGAGTGTTSGSGPHTTAGSVPKPSIPKVVTALQLCAQCSEKPCEYTNLQRLATQSYRVLVGAPQSNCDGSKKTIDADLSVSQTVSDTWGLSTTSANSAGIYQTGVQFSGSNWTETRGRAVTQKTQLKLNPGQKARFVASVQYDVSEGTLFRGGKAIGKLVSNQPSDVHSFTVQVVDCLANFVGEEMNIPPQANCKSNSATLSRALPVTLQSFTLGVGIWAGVAFMFT